MTIFAMTTNDEALAYTIHLLGELRQALDLIRANTERDELASVLQESKGTLAALYEELEDTVAYRSGRALTSLAEDLESTYDPVDGDVFSIGEQLHQESGEVRSIDRTYRVLHRAWEASVLPEQFERHLELMRPATSFGLQVGRVLTTHFTEAKTRWSRGRR